jgi:hypothetical protein
VTGPPGSEEPSDGLGASPVPTTGHWTRAPVRPVTTKGPRSSYLRGPFTHFCPACPASSDADRTAATSAGPTCAELAGSCGRRTVLLWTVRWKSKYVRKKSRKTLVGLGFRGIELSSRTPFGERGIGRRRRSVRRSPSLLGGRRGGQVTGPPGSEEPDDGLGASPVPTIGGPPDHGLAPGPGGSPRRALVAHTYEGPSSISGPSN